LRKSKISSFTELVDFLKENQGFEAVNDKETQFLGYRILDNLKIPKDIEMDEEYNNVANNLITLEYVYRKQIKRSVIKFDRDDFESEKEEKIDTNHRDYIFMIFPDLLIFKGSDDAFKIIWEDIYKILKRKFSNFEALQLSKYNLTFLFSKIFSRKISIDTDFYVDFIQDISFSDQKGSTKEFIDIRGLYNPSNSLILYHYLVERKIF